MKKVIDKSKLLETVGIYGKDGAARIFSTSKKTIIRRLFEYGLTVYDCKRSLLPSVLTKKQLSFMNGWLLGDGTIPCKQRLNKNFVFGQKYTNLEYVNFVHKLLHPFPCDVKKEINKHGHEKAYFYTVAHPIFTELRNKWYNADGLKIVPRDLRLNWQTIAAWYADDGRSSSGGVYFCTNGFLESDVCFLVDRLREDVGIDSNLYLQYDKNYDKSYPMVYVKVSSHDKFFKGIRRYLSKIEVLKYKLYHSWSM